MESRSATLENAIPKRVEFRIHGKEGPGGYLVTPPRRPLWIADGDGQIDINNQTEEQAYAIFPVGTVEVLSEFVLAVPAASTGSVIVRPTSPKEFPFQIIVGGEFAEAASDPRVRTYP